MAPFLALPSYPSSSSSSAQQHVRVEWESGSGNGTAARNDGLAAKEFALLRSVIAARAPCRLLVFGLSPQLLALGAVNARPGAATAFLTDSAEDWDAARRVLAGCVGGSSAAVHRARYPDAAGEAWAVLRRARAAGPVCARPTGTVRKSGCPLALSSLPREVLDARWDVVVVDGPSGAGPGEPGQMGAIYTAAALARVGGGEVDVAVHDVHRTMERWYARDRSIPTSSMSSPANTASVGTRRRGVRRGASSGPSSCGWSRRGSGWTGLTRGPRPRRGRPRCPRRRPGSPRCRWKFGIPGSGSSSAPPTARSRRKKNSAALTSILDPRSDPSSKDSSSAADAVWYLGINGAHITGNLNLLTDLRPVYDRWVKSIIGIGPPMQVCARGSVKSDRIKVDDVWYVPGVTVNMVAAAHFHDQELQFSMGGGACSVERPDGTVVGKGRLKDNLYELNFLDTTRKQMLTWMR